MLEFSLCSFQKVGKAEASDVLFSYLGHLDECLDPDDVRKVVALVNRRYRNFCDVLAGSDNEIEALAEALGAENMSKARLVVLWFLACHERPEAVRELMRGLNGFRGIARRIGGDIIKRFEAAVDSWEVYFSEQQENDFYAAQENDADHIYGSMGFTQPFVPEEASVDTLVVVGSIGDPLSRDGKEVAKRYDHMIGKKLPYIGRVGKISELHADLRASFPWAENVIDFVCGQLAVANRAKARRNRLILPPLLLDGGEGAGKSQFLKDLCQKLQLHYSLIPCGGTADSGGVLPVARGWASSRVAGPVQAISEGRCANPALILDEIDKASKPDTSGQNGNMSGALLSMMEAGTKGYHDSCLMADVDLSGVGFLATANDTSQMSRALRDRFMVLEMSQPKEEHFDVIFDRIRKDVAARHGASEGEIPELSTMQVEAVRDSFVENGGQVSIRALKKAYQNLLGRRCLMEEMGLNPDKEFEIEENLPRREHTLH